MTRPKQRSAWSARTPAQLMSDCAARRKSRNIQLGNGFASGSCFRKSSRIALSSASLNALKADIGFRPSAVNTQSQPSTCAGKTARASALSGRTKSTLVMFREAGNVHSPLSSPRVIAAASVRRAALKGMNRTSRPKGPVEASAARHTARNSSSVKVRSRAAPFASGGPYRARWANGNHPNARRTSS
jgi:hypothetical protein